MLRYHARTFDLIGLEPSVSEISARSLTLCEEKIRRRLPASVSEWYQLEGACRLLSQFSNADRPLDIDELGNPTTDTHGGGPHDLLTKDLLAFKWENQAVCVWAIHLDGSDDPPVVVDVDTQFRTWSPCADSFSDYVYSCVWDYALVLQRDLMVQAQNAPLSQGALAFLNEHFHSEIVTHNWPGHTQYRFFKGNRRVIIWADQKQADWYLAADTLAELKSLLRILGPVDALGGAYWSHSEEGQAVLRNLARGRPTPHGRG